jgi:hypothetical protein
MWLLSEDGVTILWTRTLQLRFAVWTEIEHVACTARHILFWFRNSLFMSLTDIPSYRVVLQRNLCFLLLCSCITKATYVLSSFMQMHKICFALGEDSVSLYINICRVIYHDFNKSKEYCTPACVKTCNNQDKMSATWRKERSTIETWDYENRRTPVLVMMLTSASCCRHV